MQEILSISSLEADQMEQSQNCVSSEQQKSDEKNKNIILKFLTRDFNFKRLFSIKNKKWLAIAYFLVFLICIFLLKLSLKCRDLLKTCATASLQAKQNILNYKKIMYIFCHEKCSSFYAFLIGERKLAPNNNEL